MTFHTYYTWPIIDVQPNNVELGPHVSPARPQCTLATERWTGAIDSRKRLQERSIDPEDYQHLAVAVAAMRKCFPDRSSTSRHHHRRHQLIYAASGTMRVRTATHTWVVPPAKALFMPAGLQHRVTAFGSVDMCTLYIEPAAISAPAFSRRS